MAHSHQANKNEKNQRNQNEIKKENWDLPGIEPIPKLKSTKKPPWQLNRLK